MRKITYMIIIALIAGTVLQSAAGDAHHPSEAGSAPPTDTVQTMPNRGITERELIKELPLNLKTGKEARLRAETRYMAEVMAKCIYGEANCCTMTEKAAVAWCILNRVDGDEWDNDIVSVITAEDQFHGYKEYHPVTDENLFIALDVIERWRAEKSGAAEPGRVLPKEYTYFRGDGLHNHFRTEWTGGEEWTWSLESPYEE